MTTRSEQWFEEARKVLPGGVNSPVRAFRAVGGTPIVMRRGQGAEVEDEDGRRYVDFVGSWGPLILGHANPEILAAVTEAMHEGLTFGAPSRRRRPGVAAAAAAACAAARCGTAPLPWKKSSDRRRRDRIARRSAADRPRTVHVAGSRATGSRILGPVRRTDAAAGHPRAAVHTDPQTQPGDDR